MSENWQLPKTISVNINITQLTVTCSKLARETLEKGVKYVPN